MADYTRMLAQLVADTSYEDLPDEVVDRAKTVMMDTLSCAVAGYTKAPEECGWIIRIAKEMGGAPESTVWMDGAKLSAMAAAMANACMVHTIDYDDTHLESVAHLGSSLLGAVLSLGEKLHASWALRWPPGWATASTRAPSTATTSTGTPPPPPAPSAARRPAPS